MKTFKISSKDINNLLYKQSAFSSNAIKNSLNLYMNGNEKKKDEYKNLAFSMNNCVNDNFFNRQRLSSY